MKGPHKYDEYGTSDCQFGCGAWMGPYSSGAPDGIEPDGDCPNFKAYDLDSAWLVYCEENGIETPMEEEGSDRPSKRLAYILKCIEAVLYSWEYSFTVKYNDRVFKVSNEAGIWTRYPSPEHALAALIEWKGELA